MKDLPQRSSLITLAGMLLGLFMTCPSSAQVFDNHVHIWNGEKSVLKYLNPELSLENLSWDKRPAKIGGFIPDTLYPFSSFHT